MFSKGAMMSATWYRSSAASLIFAVLLFLGPQVYAGDEIAAVRGRVTLDGKPLPGGRIIFHQADGQFLGSKIKKDGTFKVDRVPVGTYTITFESEGVPEKYASEETSPLRVEVKCGANSLEFELVSK
jgi:hypothetical protein